MDKLKQKGFSTIELMIALAILALILSAVVMTSFGTQAFLTSSQVNREAYILAQSMLEESQALSRKDFNLVNSTPNENLDPTGLCPIGFLREQNENNVNENFCKRLEVVTKEPDFITKEITSKVSWKDEKGLDQEVKLVSLVSNFEEAVGGNTCDSTPTGDWTKPEVVNKVEDLATLINDTSGTRYSITDIEAHKGKVYITANVNNPTVSNFFIFNIEEDGDIKYEGGMDTTGSTVSSGGNAVVVAKNSLGHFAYIANGYGANFNSCTENTNCSQLQILNVENPKSPTLIRNFKVSGITSSGGGTGNTLFYKNGYVYLGLTSTGNSEPELNIIDVHNSSSPVILGSIDTESNSINKIIARENYLYLAIANTVEQIRVIDISDPINLKKVGGFGGSGGNGKSLYMVGDSLYLGTAKGNGSKYYLLDRTNQFQISSSGIEATFNASVDEIIIRNNLAFLLTKNSLRIIDKITTNLIQSLSIDGSTSSFEPSFDCEGNTLFIGFNNSSGQGKIYVVKPE